MKNTVAAALNVAESWRLSAAEILDHTGASRERRRGTIREDAMGLSVVATEAAIEFLNGLAAKGCSEKHRIAVALDLSARGGQVHGRKGLRHAIWERSLGDDAVACFVVGQGDGTEIRILYAGPWGGRPDLDELAIAGGEHLLSIDADRWTQRDVRESPLIPEARLDALDGDLGIYLDPASSTVGDELLVQSVKEEGAIEEIGPLRMRFLELGRATEDSRLRLSPRQEEALDLPTPLLIKGVAGSGKTTILTRIAERRARECGPGDRVLLVVYQPRLQSYVESLLRSVSDKEARSRIDVLTYRDLCDRLARELGLESFAWIEDIERIVEFLRIHRKELGLSQEIGVEELIEEIRAGIKGRSLASERPLLSLEEYESGMRTPSRMPREIQARVYEAAERYQVYLEAQEKFDDLDAARLLLGREDDLNRWTHVLVDEAQDFTLVQLALLVRLARRFKGLVLAGDELQVVQASSFSWDRAEEAIRLHGYRDKVHQFEIEVNYRNPRPLVELGQALLAMRAKSLNLPAPHPMKTDRSELPLPVMAVSNDPGRLVRLLGENIPSLGVIYPSSKDVELEEWSYQGIDFRRGYSPQSVKGIEFDVVCLVDLGWAFGDLGRKHKHLSWSREIHRFNQLYVAMTRARHLLIVADSSRHTKRLWERLGYERWETVASNEEILARALEQVPSAEAGWRLAAQDFELQRSFGAAAECWLRVGGYQRAAHCFEKIDHPDQAAELQEYLGLLEEAATNYSLAGDAQSSFRCRAILLEKSNRLEESAEHWERAGNHGKAAENWESTGDHKKAAVSWEKAGEHKRAAENWKKAGDHKKVAVSLAKYWEKAEKHEKAAENWERAGDHRKAAENWEKAENHEKAAENWERAGDHRKAAEIWEKAENHEKAAENWEISGNARKAAESWARYWEKAENHEKAAVSWEKAENHEKAAVSWQAIGEHEKAARNWEKAGNKRKAAENWERIRDHGKAAGNWQAIGEYEKAAIRWEKARDYGKAAENWGKAGDHKRAAVNWGKVLNSEKAAISWEKAGDYKRAAEIWQAIEEYERAVINWAMYWEKAKNPEMAAKYWEKAVNPRNAARNWVKADRPELANENLKKIKR